MRAGTSLYSPVLDLLHRTCPQPDVIDHTQELHALVDSLPADVDHDRAVPQTAPA
jgi:hypothetical protein